MFKTMPKRKRLLLATLLAGFLFLVIVLAAAWQFFKPQSHYRPGEKIEGLTDDLARSIPKDAPKNTFVDATAKAGIVFQHFSGKRSIQLPEDMGSGAAWGDYDNDGWLDLFVVNEAGPLNMTADQIKQSGAHCALFHNNGDGTFTETSRSAGVDYRGWGMAAAWADYNNDGWLDIFLTCYGENVFYRNNGDGTFTDLSQHTGLNGKTGFWTGASWADFNRDGFLDLYVCGYVKYSSVEDQALELQYDVEVPASLNPSSFAPERNLLYLNNGDGTFSEIAAKAGVENLQGRSLSAAWCDFDEDGWPDLYVANDVSDNMLFRNLGNQAFQEISLASWVADYRGAMGIAVGDWDGDSDMDMFVTHWIAQENALYSNMLAQFTALGTNAPNTLKFMDEADRFGLGQIALDFIGWGTSFFDFNNDGRLDLYVVNGSTFQQKEKPWLLIPMKNQFFWNGGAEEGFYDISAVNGEVFKYNYVGRGAAFGDYDNDGDVDIFVVNNGGPGILLRNESSNGNRWLKVSLQGVQSNPQAIGAKMRLVVGNTVQIRQVGAQSSYCSQNSLIQHFGLGAFAKADTLEIIWPSGLKQVILDVAADQTIQVLEGKGIVEGN